MSNVITADDLRRILATSAGATDSASIDGDALDKAFDDLGYDSLALMETASAIGREFGIVIPDDELFDLETPRALLELANGLVRTAG
ncbi:acyl carrier protein [Streptomyces olivaceus]|uniref:acyl carrier protein n=1 Tax=Streptomyces olivaceus TaxID=47716 RepID=UPI001CCCB252|nr:acyl carrier protein [Streptomyces olivaceus]MBZ6296071.1 acyl carrier protein [Streptomyces olivaceus]MBZ6331019.1 acyl carrier protein [Streptomyces olivaceus]